MVNQNLIHIKLGYKRALESKKEVLLLERDSLQIAQTIKNYHILRVNELNSKIKFNSKLKALLGDVRKLKRILPKVDIEKAKEEKHEKVSKAKTKPVKKKKYSSDIEFQLMDIQNKLNALQG